MTDEISFDGVRYISASDAAHSAGLTRDYIARLCRGNKVRGKQIGKNWYVSKESMDSFLLKQEHEHVARNEELARKRAEEYQNALQQQEGMNSGMGNKIIEKSDNESPYFPASHAGSEGAGANTGNSLLYSTPFREISKSPKPAKTIFVPRAQQEALRQSGSRPVISQYPSIHKLAAGVSALGKMGSASSGFIDAAYRLTPHAAVSVSPVTEFAHKLVALFVAGMLTFGTYSIVDPQYARMAYEATKSAGQKVAELPAAIARGDLEKWAGNTSAQLAAAALDPQLAGSKILAGIKNLARRAQEYLDNAIYAMMFSGKFASLLDSSASTDGSSTDADAHPIGSFVTAEISPLNASQSGASGAATAIPSSSSGQATTIINNPVVERVIIRQQAEQRLLSVGGISEEILNKRLEQLDNKLTSQMFSLSAANSTVTAQNYVVTAQTNKIDQLYNTRINNPTIAGGSLTDVSISASSLSVSGATTLGTLTAGSTTLANLTAASADVSGNIGIGGSLSLSGTSASITAENAAFTNATTTNATSTNFFATYASTTNATSTNLFSVLGRFTTGVIDTLTSTLATISDLTATTLVATNATTTNATTTALYVSGLAQLTSVAAGTTTLTNLAVTNTSTSTFAGGLTFGTSQFVLQQATGRIGIGTTSPASIFDIYGTDALRLP
ncbi:MAG TPA: helix-turn-helix domain-containing protein, partial [Candidatus Paceibacterota bacterium]|nr:helix-turn-helix domain-containing protein [Candidatus Paceibacterota bacterium]